MNRIFLNVAIVCGAVLIVCVLLDVLGMGDIVKAAGSHLREKAGLEAAQDEEYEESELATKSGFTNEIENLLGFSLREIRTQPEKMQRVAREKILAKIDALEALRIRAVGSLEETERNLEELKAQQSGLRRVLDEARRVVDDPAAAYPVQVGNFVYQTKHDLLVAAADIRKRADAIGAQVDKLSRVPGAARENERKIKKYVELLEGTLFQLEAISPLVEANKISKGVEEEGRDTGKLTSPPGQISVGITEIKEQGTRDPTDEDLKSRAFAP